MHSPNILTRPASDDCTDSSNSHYTDYLSAHTPVVVIPPYASSVHYTPRRIDTLRIATKTQVKMRSTVFHDPYLRGEVIHVNDQLTISHEDFDHRRYSTSAETLPHIRAHTEFNLLKALDALSDATYEFHCKCHHFYTAMSSSNSGATHLVQIRKAEALAQTHVDEALEKLAKADAELGDAETVYVQACNPPAPLSPAEISERNEPPRPSSWRERKAAKVAVEVAAVKRGEANLVYSDAQGLLQEAKRFREISEGEENARMDGVMDRFEMDEWQKSVAGMVTDLAKRGYLRDAVEAQIEAREYFLACNLSEKV